MRILCLHSFRTSARIFNQQVQRSGLGKVLGPSVQLDYLDAPIPATGAAPDDVSPHFDAPYYEWWSADKDVTGAWTYAGCRAAIELVAQRLRTQGPYDGIMGFSQGGGLTAVIAGMQQHKLLPEARADELRPAFTEPITLPSMHIVGHKDTMKMASDRLATCFTAPHLLRHPGDTTEAYELLQGTLSQDYPKRKL